MTLLLGIIFSATTTFALNCINMHGRYRVEGHPTAIVQYEQKDCSAYSVRESEDGVHFTDWQTYPFDALFRETPRGSLVRAWTEGNYLRKQIIYYSVEQGKHIESLDHWNAFDADGNLLAWEKIYDLKGNFIKNWNAKFIPID